MISTLLATGQLSPLRFLLEIQEATRDCPSSVYHAIFDHFVCRREMADNLCLFNPNYDKIIAAPKWARDTLAKHQVRLLIAVLPCLQEACRLTMQRVDYY